MNTIRIINQPRRIPVHKALACKSSLPALAPSRSLSMLAQPSPLHRPMDWSSHICDIDAEPLYRYHKVGYHPVHLGDYLSNGRYKVLHKLGWGGYSTVWAARDTRTQNYVAIKIAVSEPNHQNRESTILRTIAAKHSDHPGYQHLMTIQDAFQINGPNGYHQCLVLELLGPSVADYLEQSGIERLPGALAKTIAKQTLLGLSFLHKHKIAHADLHTLNLAFTIPTVYALQEEDFLQNLGRPETGNVYRKDGKPLGPGIPRYLVTPTSYPLDDIELLFKSIKIIDFGQSFLPHQSPGTLRTPLPLRAPEIIFNDNVDYRVDMWSMGCLLFELIVAQPLFDSVMSTPPILIRQMLDTVGDELPHRWRGDWDAMKGTLSDHSIVSSLQDWLEEMYFDGVRRGDMRREDVGRVGVLIGRMLRLEPAARVEAEDVVGDYWFWG